MSNTEDYRRTALPIADREPTVGYKYDATDPGQDFPPIEPLRPPAGAPNVIIALIDDVGLISSPPRSVSESPWRVSRYRR